MSFAFDSGEALPNADVPRLREYAKIMTQVSDLVEAIQETGTKTDLDNDFTVEVDKKPGIMIPQIVTDMIGEVSFISAKLKLAVDIMHEDDEVADENEEFSSDSFYNDPAYEQSIPADNAVVRQATNISLQFFSSNGVFLVSRTNLSDETHEIKDNISLTKYPRGEITPVEAVSERDLAALIISIVNPGITDSYSDKPFDMTSPEAFSALSSLLSTTTRSNINDSIRYLPEPDSHFKHRQQYDPKADRMKTSFQIKYRSSEDPERLIIATHSLDTNFQLSFETITPGGPFTPQAIEDTPKRIPYEPTLIELSHLTDILQKEVSTVSTNGREVEVEDLDTLSEVDAITQEQLFEVVETDYEFGQIAEHDTRRDFQSLAGIALSSELDDEPTEADPDEND